MGAGHDTAARAVAGALAGAGWSSRTLDSMALLGPRAARLGESTLRALLARPTLYDGLHFSHLRPGGPLAAAMDRLATRALVPALQHNLAAAPCELVVSVFATGASAAAQLRRAAAVRRAVVVCTDVAVHRLWIAGGTDAYLVTSAAAAASVRRHAPWARVQVVPAPVDPAFHAVPDRAGARAALGVPAQARCVLLLGGGWGLGPLVGAAEGLADAGVHVLAVAGRNTGAQVRLRKLAQRQPRLHPFGFTDLMPTLMAAADLVATTPGAATCAEARAARRPLLLLDVVPGHGRDNAQHELARGGAAITGGAPRQVVSCALAALDSPPGPLPDEPGGFAAAFRRVLAELDLPAVPSAAPPVVPPVAPPAVPRAVPPAVPPAW